MLGGTGTVFSLELIIPHDWGEFLLCTLHDAHESWGFLVWLMGAGIIYNPLRVQLYRPMSNPFRWFCPQPQVVFSHTWNDPGDFQRNFHRSPQLSLGAALLSLILCSVNLRCIVLCRLSALSSHHKESAGIFLSTPPVLWSGNHPKTVIWGNGKAHLSGIIVLRCLMSRVWQTVFSYIFSVFLMFQMGG